MKSDLRLRSDGHSTNSGLGIQVREELRQWFHTRRWWLTALSLAAVMALLAVLILPELEDNGDDAVEAIYFLNGLLGVAGGIAVVILMQNALVGEKKSGVAAWVLSKPISRPSYYLAKIIGHGIAVTVVIVIGLGLFGYAVLIGMLNADMPITLFVAGLLPHVVNMMFYITLTLMLGAIFNSRTVVLAIAIAPLLLDETFLAAPPGRVRDVLFNSLPWGLVTGYGEVAPSIAGSIMLGDRPYSLLPLLTTVGMSIAFAAIGIIFFHRSDL